MTDPMEAWKNWVPRATYDEQEARANQAEAVARVLKGTNERLAADAEAAESVIERVRELGEQWIGFEDEIAMHDAGDQLLSLLNPKESEHE